MAQGRGTARGCMIPFHNKAFSHLRLWFAVFAAVTVTGRVQAVTITVTTSTDAVVTDGWVSLREAMTAASTNAASGDAPAGTPGFDRIQFSSPVVIVAASEMPQVSDELLISGIEPMSTVIHGNTAVRLFSVASGTSVTMQNLMIMAGVAPGNADGGGIHNLGAVTLINCWFNQCAAPNRGGAIYTGNGSRLRIECCIVAGCTALHGGGVMLHRAQEAVLLDTLLLLNSAGVDGGGVRIVNCNGVELAGCSFRMNTALGNGGAIHDDSPLVMTKCCAVDNGAGNDGGGLYKAGSGDLLVVNTTFSGNAAAHNGGGLLVMGGLAQLQHVTVANNTAYSQPPTGGTGGGIHTTGTALLTVANCLVASNTNTLPAMRPDIAGLVYSGGYNVIGSLGLEVFPTNTTGDHYGDPYGTTPPNAGAARYATVLDPGMTALEVHGVTDTRTHGLLIGSIALDNAHPASAALEDQRGYPRPVGGRADIGAFESRRFEAYDDDPFHTGGLEPPGSLTGWSGFGFNTPGFAWPEYSAAAGAYRGHVAAHATRFRVAGIISNLSNWLPYEAVTSECVARAKFYVYAGGQANPADLNQIPNLRLRLANRFAVNSMLEVFHHNPGDPGNAALAAELRPSSLPTSPSLYRVDCDPVDVPYLRDHAAMEGVARAFEAYALFPQENGYLALTESAIGVYPVSLVHPTGPVAKVYAPDGNGAGDLDLFNPAEVSLLKLIPGTTEGAFALLDLLPPLPTHTTSTAGILLDTAGIPPDRIGVAAREFNPDRNANDHASRVRVEEGRQYVIRWALSSDQDTNKQAQIRLRARSVKFAWSQKMEIGGAWATDGGKTDPLNANNSIAQQSLPGIGGANPEDNGFFGTTGWYSIILHSPMNADIRGDFAPGTPLSVRMPNITAQSGPGVALPSRRDIFLGMDLVDSLSGGLGAPLEQGNVALLRAEIRNYALVPD
jgi:hypothetical protein